uniref:W2 domain-containing protein n=1 Tax=Globodera pallida TaxID=36090 RepID=A0A183CGT2_GLOPA
MDNQKQQQLDVLIILDKSSEITPLAHDKTYARNRSFNDRCVQWVSKLNSPNVIVAFVNQPEEIAVKFLTKWSSGFKQLQAFCVHNCQSLNDVLREIDSRQMLRNDFVLIQNCATFCSSYLARQIEKFKIQRRQNKKNVLTLLYYEKSEALLGTLEDDASSSGQQKLSADLLNKIKLEINASKLAYNIPLDEVPNHLFSAFLRLPGVVDKFSNFTKMYNYWHGLWKIYYKTTAAQSQMLFAIEENTAISDRFRRILPNVLFFLSQDVKVLDDALIVDWYNSKLESKSPLKSEEKLAELVGWIQNAAEESRSVDVPYHNMNGAQYSRIVKDLILILRYRVELYEEITPNKFSLKAKGVIGNLDDFEDIVSGSIELAELSTIMCVWLVDDDLSTENKMSLVFCNSQDMRIVTTELNDTPNFTLFEQCFASFQPSECLLIRQNARRAPNRFKKLESVIQRTQAQRNYLEEAEEDTNKCRDEVRRLFHKKFAELEFPPVVWATMRALLSHAQLLADAQNEGAFAVMRYGQHGFMHLSNAALQALDIFAIGGEIDAFAAVSSSSATLHDHLNKCRSQPGKRLIREWMRQPLFNHRQIEGSVDVPYHNMNSAQYSRIVKDLILILRYRVELYEEITPNKFSLKAKGVIGNLDDFEDIVSGSIELAELSTIMCVWLNKMSLVFCNSQDMRIVTTELNDTPNFTLFEQCFASFQPSECLLIRQNARRAPNRFKKLESVIQRTQAQRNYLEEAEEDTNKCRDEVRRLFHKKFAELEFPPIVWATMRALLSHAQLLADAQNEGAFAVMRYGQHGFMHLSNAALQALDIFAIGGEIDAFAAVSSSSATLHDHLNKCRSQPGKRLIREWMRQPLFNHRQIEERLDVVEILTTFTSIRQTLYNDYLRRIPDVKLLARKLVQKKAGLVDCFRLYQLIVLLNKMMALFKELDEEVDGKLISSLDELIRQPLHHSAIEFERFKALIEETLDFKQTLYNDYLRRIPDVKLLARKLVQKKAGLVDCFRLYQLIVLLNKMMALFKELDEEVDGKLISSLDELIRQPLHHSAIEFERFKALIEETLDFKYLKENGQYRIKPEIDDNLAMIATQIRELDTKAQRESDKMATRLKIEVKIESRIDVGFFFRITLKSEAAIRGLPNVHILDSTKGSGRHELSAFREGMQFIPNDLTMGKNAECGQFMILTGANMGGKSTYLKAAALTVLMGQMGSFVPCASATFSMIDGIYTRVGAGDFQCKGISTFMAEMMDCASTLECATSNSLILVDELGRGTSTYDGFGLAWAISEDIVTRIGCFAIFATHFHEISQLERKYPNKVKNYRMDTFCEDGQLTILFRVVPGVADRSFGLHIAKMVGFPDELMKDAETILPMAVFTLIIPLQLALIAVASVLLILAQCCGGGGKKDKKKAKQPARGKPTAQTPPSVTMDPDIFLNPPQGTPMPQRPGSPVITPVAANDPNYGTPGNLDPNIFLDPPQGTPMRRVPQWTPMPQQLESPGIILGAGGIEIAVVPPFTVEDLMAPRPDSVVDSVFEF